MNSPIIIDSKPDYTRAGLSSGDTPTVVFPTNSVTSKAPMDAYGMVTNWDGMKDVLSHTFKQLGVDPSQHSIIITEPPLNSEVNREKMTQIFFETFKVSGFYLIMRELLALYDGGNLNGTVINFGENGSCLVIVPCYQGSPFTHAIIQYSLKENKINDQEVANIADRVYASIFRCDSDVRHSLYSNIILTGSSSMYTGISTKLRDRVAALAPPNATVKIVEANEPENAAWRGGDKMAPLLNENGSWITKQEYQQYGAKIVHDKCFQ
ncbi:actin family protein [Crocosphaera sp. XPORK-15E]|uniref:actin family protein n=1 Tax=Crocosphaera sp. XPORK-15E TaxID=3110247 RepID=UPI002B1EBD91|nr:actin family protein [Crocosphaera sp. XPORK-15E]MEA5537220.1 actin family protein [Crocosphaera sp. XPORK-15E]